MPFVKVVKSKAYFKRFQVQYRRRREGKTDYHARRQMVLQDKTKFGSPKYRLVVRFTNRDIIAQVVQAKIGGDKIVCAAYAHELPLFGIEHGLTNYAAAYATGLLLARRTLTKMKIADKFPGVKEADGSFFQSRTKKNDLDDEDSPFSFKAILDVGLARTTTGARIFGVLKGAVDGGMAVPHSDSRFPGYKDNKLNVKVHRDHIFGKHVADYLKLVKEELSSNPDEQLNQFSKYIKASISPDSIEGIYKKAHAAIRADPCKTFPKKAAPASTGPRKHLKAKKLSCEDRKAAAKAKVASIRARASK